MNAMDYEKKYNEALNLAKSYYGEGCNEFLDTIFPELAESEDERIRKWIYNIVENLGYPADEAAEKELEEMQPLALAYLEKQKERKLTNSEKPKEWSGEDESYLQTVINEIEANKKEALEYEHK